MTRPWLPLALLAGLAVPAPAQAASYGLTLGLALPTNDLRRFDDRCGAALGAVASVELGYGIRVRPRLEASWLPGARTMDLGQPSQRRVATLMAMLDFVYHFERPDAGWYALAGAGLQRLQARTAGGARDGTEITSRMAGALGLGYDVDRHWGVEARYGYSTFGTGAQVPQGSEDPTSGLLVLAVVHRF